MGRALWPSPFESMKLLSLVLLLWAAAAPAAAQELKLQINDGQVSLQADAVSVRRILAEWERVGGTRVSGVDRIPDEWLTLRLVNVPERSALDTILRNVAGYMAESRGAGPATGASVYGRLWIMVTSAAPAAAAPLTQAELLQTASEAPEVQVAADGYNGAAMAPGHVPAPGAAGLPPHAPMPAPGPAAGFVVQGQMGRRGEPGSRPPAESMLAPAPFPTGPRLPIPKK